MNKKIQEVEESLSLISETLPSGHLTERQVAGFPEGKNQAEVKKEVVTESMTEMAELKNRKTKNTAISQMNGSSKQAVFTSLRKEAINDQGHTKDTQNPEFLLEEDGCHYCCSQRTFIAKFNCDEEAKELFSIERGQYKVTAYKKDSGKYCRREKPMLVQKIEGVPQKALLFPQIGDGADLEYLVKTNGVKENIIVSQKATEYQYQFVLHCQNTVAQFDSSRKRVAFCAIESGEEVFYIPAPFMIDANGEISYDVFFESGEDEDGDILLCVSADSKWINAEERCLPVKIDPQILVSDNNYVNSYSWSNNKILAEDIHTVGVLEVNQTNEQNIAEVNTVAPYSLTEEADVAGVYAMARSYPISLTTTDDSSGDSGDDSGDDWGNDWDGWDDNWGDIWGDNGCDGSDDCSGDDSNDGSDSNSGNNSEDNCPNCPGDSPQWVDTSNTKETADSIGFNAWTAGELCCPDADYWYSFVANAEDAHVDGSKGIYSVQTSGAMNVYADIIDSNDRVIGSSGTLTYGETYYIRVTASAVGSYSVRLGYTVKDNSNCKECAQSIAINTRTRGKIRVVGGEYWYSFVAGASSIPVAKSKTSYKLYVEGSKWASGILYNSDDEVIGTGSSNGSTGSFSITAQLEKGETYYVRISMFNNKTGVYYVTASKIGTEVTTVNFKTWYGGTVRCPEDECWYKFTANAEKAHVNGAAGTYKMCTVGSLDTMGFLYDDTGKCIGYNDDCNGHNFCISASLAYDRTYYLCVKAYGSNTGSYEVKVDYELGKNPLNRMYLDINMPSIPRNPRIKKAEITFYQQNGVNESGAVKYLGLYHAPADICEGDCAPAVDTELIDYCAMKTGHYENGSMISYTFDITEFVDMVAKSETYYPHLALKLTDESMGENAYVKLYGSSHSQYAPELRITYDSSYGVNTSYRTHTHELGRFGQGSIDLACGNLMFESSDFAWGGTRMPVTIKHLYNSALSNFSYTANTAIGLRTANFSSMKMGLGWKLNIMQSMVAAQMQLEDSDQTETGYVYIGENGEETCFKKTAEAGIYEDVDGNGMKYDEANRTLKQGGEAYLFDTSGRLIRITDEHNNQMNIVYTSGKITSVTDGAGRAFTFAYSNNFLTSITAPDCTEVRYTYNSNCLASVTYPTGERATVSYTATKPNTLILYDADTNPCYRVSYSFNYDRVAQVYEYGVENRAYKGGSRTWYSYSAAAGRTTVTTFESADEGETTSRTVYTVYTFDEDGGVVGQYTYTSGSDKTGLTGESAGLHPLAGDGVVAVSSSDNLLRGHDFSDTSLNFWSGESVNSNYLTCESQLSHRMVPHGCHYLYMNSTAQNGCGIGLYQTTVSLPKGEYTFSAYCAVAVSFDGDVCAPGAYIRVTDEYGTVLAESEHLETADRTFTRLIAPFTLTAAKRVKVHLLTNGAGAVMFNAPQLENNPYANTYNSLINGSFEDGITGWDPFGQIFISTAERFSMNRALLISGGLDEQGYVYQSVPVKNYASIRETFTLSGWAKACGLPVRERDGAEIPRFRLYAVITYADGTTQTETADFAPRAEEWQFASVQFAKDGYKSIRDFKVYCEYSYNFGEAYFDDVQLVRDSLELDLTRADFEFDEEPEDENDAETDTETEVEETTAFEEFIDSYGNTLTETTFTDGEFGTIYRSFGYDASANNLVRETDARGNITRYTVDGATSRNEAVTDRLGNKTVYEYDDAGRTTKVTSENANGTPLANVSYCYDAFDNMTEIVRGDGMKYVLAYNAYHNLESIGVDGTGNKLVTYTYKNGNGRLKAITYANGDTMKATYNNLGQMIGEAWYNSSNTLVSRYQYVYDNQGNIVRSIDFAAEKEYNYTYEEGRIVRSTECDIVVTNDIVTEKTLVNSVRYFYDKDGNLTGKVIAPKDSASFTYHYETTDGNTIVKFSAGNAGVMSHSKTDSFGRKEFDELQLGNGSVSRTFAYHAGDITDEHRNNGKVKSSATTQLVSQIALSDGRTLSYGYDAEERITSVVETYTVDETSVANTTLYTYDALGQLLAEKKNGSVVNFMTYDNYGNILSKNGKAYTYGNTKWKDLLTSYDGKTITYDAQGNPTYYLGHNLTWEKGRQLKSFDGNTYTYNANGIRTSKTVGGVKHTYTLDGTKILRETCHNNVLIPLYDNEDSVCGIIYNGTPYYFLKNLQGDIIAITNQNGEVVARYSYDAWGVPTIVEDSSGCSIATINPFRYRGYYYDIENGMYYLQSRYYDASVGRFINGDSKLGINSGVLSYALYCYCGNDPICRGDTLGYAWWSVLTKTVVALITVAHIVNAAVSIYQANYNKSHDVKSIVERQGDVDMLLGGVSFAKMGCGAAATHNAIILAGGLSSLAEVVEFMQAHDLTLGFAGVYFTNIQLYLKRKGYSNKIYLSKLKNNIDQKIKQCSRKIAILAFKHSSGGHYVAIRYDDTDKVFYVYNSNRTLDSIDTWIKDNSYFPLCLITI